MLVVTIAGNPYYFKTSLGFTCLDETAVFY